MTVFLCSCSTMKNVLEPYRANIGFAGYATEFKDKNTKRKICVEDSPNPDGSKDACSGGGFKSYRDRTNIDVGYETRPYYFSERLGWFSDLFGASFFLTYNSIGTTLLDYPFNGEKTNVRVSRYAVNPFVYMNFGDKYFIKNKGRNFRFGIGLSANYLNTLEVTRQSTMEKVEKDNAIELGYSVFAEFNWNWFYFRLSNSNINAKISSFNGVADNNELEINETTAAIGIAYYFEEQDWYNALWKPFI